GSIAEPLERDSGGVIQNQAKSGGLADQHGLGSGLSGDAEVACGENGIDFEVIDPLILVQTTGAPDQCEPTSADRTESWNGNIVVDHHAIKSDIDRAVILHPNQHGDEGISCRDK